jgi:hypothetical protein
MSCTCDIPFEDCKHAVIYPNRDKWYCDKPQFQIITMEVPKEHTDKIKELIKAVDFQLDNVKGYMLCNAPESAAVKADYVTRAAKELEEYLSKHYG